MKPQVSVQGLGVVQGKNEICVGTDSCVSFSSELGGLPHLPFILAQVLDDKRFDILDAKKALSGGLNCEPAEVACDPAPS